MVDSTIPRRRFLLGAGLAGTAVAAGLAPEFPIPAEAEASATPAAVAPLASPASPESETLLTLTANEAAFVTAAVDTLIPADEFSPAGSDCGIVTFIDRQLGSDWGGGSKMYRSGPFHKGKPEQVSFPKIPSGLDSHSKVESSHH